MTPPTQPSRADPPQLIRPTSDPRNDHAQLTKGTASMDYALWLLSDATGAITLSGWAETTDATTEHWPTYTLCQDHAQLPARLAELGLNLAPGADINDFDNDWDIYVTHPDITALRAQLDNKHTHKTD
jgi:hypothetical protein